MRHTGAATPHAHKALTKIKEGKPALSPPAWTSGTPSDPKAFIGRDDKELSYLIAPEVFKKMAQEERCNASQRGQRFCHPLSQPCCVWQYHSYISPSTGP
jgi:hypothetical protein